MAKRRRYIDGDVQHSIEKLAISAPNWTPSQIMKWLKSQPGLVGRLPSLRTIQTIVKETRLVDPSEPWALTDDSEEAAFLLSVLGAVVELPESRKVRLTHKEAEWLERIKCAMPDIPPLTAYWFTHAYMLCEGASQDTAHLDMGLALTPTAGEVDALSELAAVKARIALHIDIHLRLWPGRFLMVWPRAAWISEEYAETAKSRGGHIIIYPDPLSPTILEIWFEGGVQ